ncbi:MAG: SpoIIE family protein phosphatase [Salibacteraceae bacterium]
MKNALIILPVSIIVFWISVIKTEAQDTIRFNDYSEGLELTEKWSFTSDTAKPWLDQDDNLSRVPLEICCVFNSNSEDTISKMGWFSIFVRTNDSMAHLPLALTLNLHGGAMKVYVNKKLLKSFGEPSSIESQEIQNLPISNQVLVFNPDTSGLQRIDVLYSNHRLDDIRGFKVLLGDPHGFIFTYTFSLVVSLGFLLFIFGGYASIAIVHLSLFFFFKDDKNNLFFGISMLLLSVLSACGMASILSTTYSKVELIENLSLTTLYGFSIFLSLFLLNTFYQNISKWNFLLIIYACIGILLVYIPLDTDSIYIFNAYFIVWTISTIAILLHSFIKKKPASRYVGFGMLSFLIGLFLAFVVGYFMMTNEMDPNSGIVSYKFVGLGFTEFLLLLSVTLIIFSLPTSMSIFLGKKSAVLNKDLKLQLNQVQLLSAETLKKEQEKQSILANQKKVLEYEVDRQTKELRNQKEHIEEAHKEITDSINYAKRIQTAILPPDRIVKEYLQNSFILYKPKDVVAGDFYWLEPVSDTVYFAAADCTGHGVPGAMVSVICNNGLNRSVREFGLCDPGEILDKTRELVIQEFEKSEEEVKDGMDISLCALGPIVSSSSGAYRELRWAGANNPLWVVRKGAEEIEEIKADKQPIGKYHHETPFTSHKIKLHEGDTIYIFSDGYPDQFGGDNGKKYKSGNFKRRLLELAQQPIEKQKDILDLEFERWRGELEQIDDVCVIGVRI